MATRTCPSCGTQYVASVRLCIDCDRPLVEDRTSSSSPSTDERAGEPDSVADEDASTPEPLGRADGGRVHYDLEGWGNSIKVSLAGILERAAILHVWEAGTLVVSDDDEEKVDQLITELGGVEADHGEDGEVLVAFEIEGLTGEDQEELDARLLAAGLDLTWSEEGDLIVPAADEDRVAQIIDEVLNDEGDDATDGLAVNAALSSLFVATDRLAKSPSDDKTVRGYVEAAATLEDLGVPYGVARAEWQDLVAEVDALAVRCNRTEGSDLSDDTDDARADDSDGSSGPSDDAEGDTEDGSEDGPEDEPEGGATEVGEAEQVSALASDLRERLRDLV